MLPKKVYIYEEDSEGFTFLMATRELPEEEGLEVGTYELVEKGKISVTVEYKKRQ